MPEGCGVGEGLQWRAILDPWRAAADGLATARDKCGGRADLLCNLSSCSKLVLATAEQKSTLQ